MTAEEPPTARNITLSQTAPWNARLTNPYRTRYTQDGRYFRIHADWLAGPWYVEEITTEGNPLGGASIVICFNLPAARQAICDLLSGMTSEEVNRNALSAPPAGTGRNHPDHVARRQTWRRR